MSTVYFYQLTTGTLEDTLPQLLQKSLQAGLTVFVCANETQALERLDELLWQKDFLPHGIVGGAYDAQQPILLGGPNNDERHQCNSLLCVMGAPVTPQDVQHYQRVSVLFRSTDERELQAARGQWKALTASGCAAQYWAQENGRWVKKAEST